MKPARELIKDGEDPTTLRELNKKSNDFKGDLVSYLKFKTPMKSSSQEEVGPLAKTGAFALGTQFLSLIPYSS